MIDPKIKQYQADQERLDAYLKSAWGHIEDAGVFYERYIGYLFEIDGYTVEYSGIKKGLEDSGRDLIARKGIEELVIQCKNWARAIINEKHIYQLFGSSTHLQYHTNKKVRSLFITSGVLSSEAIRAAQGLGVEVRHIAFNKKYPMVKCNINDLGKLYHLPFGKWYDSVQIDTRVGDCFVHSVQQAVDLGFCSAYLIRKTG